MPRHGGGHKRYLQVEHLAAAGLVAGQVRQHDGSEALQYIDCENRQRGPRAQHPERIGRPGVAAAVFPDVDAVKTLADPYGARNRPQHIGHQNEKYVQSHKTFRL